jgi:hypothetical protein
VDNRRAKEYDILLPDNEIQRAEVSDHVTLETASVVEVELLQRLAGREPGGADPALTAMRFARGDLTLQAGYEKFLV